MEQDKYSEERWNRIKEKVDHEIELKGKEQLTCSIENSDVVDGEFCVGFVFDCVWGMGLRLNKLTVYKDQEGMNSEQVSELVLQTQLEMEEKFIDVLDFEVLQSTIEYYVASENKNPHLNFDIEKGYYLNTEILRKDLEKLLNYHPPQIGDEDLVSEVGRKTITYELPGS